MVSGHIRYTYIYNSCGLVTVPFNQCAPHVLIWFYYAAKRKLLEHFMNTSVVSVISYTSSQTWSNVLMSVRLIIEHWTKPRWVNRRWLTSSSSGFNQTICKTKSCESLIMNHPYTHLYTAWCALRWQGRNEYKWLVGRHKMHIIVAYFISRGENHS